MTTGFDPGYVADPFLSLCADCPGAGAYPADDFRVEWGPVFHRGRLDGSARLLALGQDPAQHEVIARRILVGAAGHRVQGFLAKLGLTRSYVLLNTFLYSVYGQQAALRHRDDPEITAYRHRWLEAVLAPGSIQGVVAFGSLAHHAWQLWLASEEGKASAGLAYVHVPHPTYPEGAGGTPEEQARLTAKMLAKWNWAIEMLHEAVTDPDEQVVLAPYGEAFRPEELPEIPAGDLPAGSPAWMGKAEVWAVREGEDAATRRRRIVVTVPDGAMVTAVAPFAAVSVADTGPPPRRLALTGRVVTMNADRKIFRSGTLYVEDGAIVDIRTRSAAPPDGFETVTPLETAGTIFPGLVELHNHLSYNVLPRWVATRRYDNRGQWQSSEPQYGVNVTGPMGVLARSNDRRVLPALIRWVETKCLVSGTTTSQGIGLSNSSGKVKRLYKGLVRNVELASGTGCEGARTQIPDVEASKLAEFKLKLERPGALLLHLAEGVDESARKHFLKLKMNGSWAVNGNLVGIHCTALEAADMQVLADGQASLVWSPLSNYSLYGGTTRAAEAKRAGVKMAIGSDWSPNGSKNLLAELKVVRAVGKRLRLGLRAADVVAMATSGAAAIAQWERAVGSLERGKRADLLVLAGADGNAYEGLLAADERAIQLVMIDGVPRVGTPELMERLGVRGEALTVGGEARVASFDDPRCDPLVQGMSLAEARSVLEEILAGLPNQPLAMAAPLAAGAGPEWRLALDEQVPVAADHEPRAPFSAAPMGGLPRDRWAAAASELPLHPLNLDPLTVADDPQYGARLQAEPNLPAWLKASLARLFP